MCLLVCTCVCGNDLASAYVLPSLQVISRHLSSCLYANTLFRHVCIAKMIETLAREWKDESGIIELVKNDQNTLKKKVKAFLKNLFKPVDSNESDSEGRFDSQQVLLKLADLSECIESIGHRKVCKPFILCILDLFIGHSRIREFLLEKRDGFVRRKLVELFCLLCSSQLDAAKEQENLIDLILGAYDATFSVEGMLH